MGKTSFISRCAEEWFPGYRVVDRHAFNFDERVPDEGVIHMVDVGRWPIYNYIRCGIIDSCFLLVTIQGWRHM